MSDDNLKLTPNNINWDINLQSNAEKTPAREYSLFHCPSCGIHPQVICETHVRGFDDFIQIRLINILPENEEIICVLGDKLPGDVETYDTLICGLCGKPGHIENVPEFVLSMHGIIKPIEMNTNDD
jgi:hypothetical protein|tara:strand:- start:310 stop:687 length:378 start_codon:yes stop_codon:yes gene_type:complete